MKKSPEPSQRREQVVLSSGRRQAELAVCTLYFFLGEFSVRMSPHDVLGVLERPVHAIHLIVSWRRHTRNQDKCMTVDVVDMLVVGKRRLQIDYCVRKGETGGRRGGHHTIPEKKHFGASVLNS